MKYSIFNDRIRNVFMALTYHTPLDELCNIAVTENITVDDAHATDVDMFKEWYDTELAELFATEMSGKEVHIVKLSPDGPTETLVFSSETKAQKFVEGLSDYELFPLNIL